MAQAGLRRHIVERRAFVDQLGQRRRFLQRAQILPLQVFDGGNAQRSSLDSSARISTGHLESPASSPRSSNSFRARKRRSPLTIRKRWPLPHRTDDEIVQQAVSPDAGRKALDGRCGRSSGAGCRGPMLPATTVKRFA